ncbi:MAG TPA: neutral zinc metallopeptidase [Gemmatimonadota bacterium]|jgi:predicted metalloprotease|nr:neutral zinc metallopeptidase [Gemmatimonadota bacterium]
MVRWKGRTRSTNVEDRRGRGVGLAGGGIGLLLILLIGLCLGVDPQTLFQVAEQTQTQTQPAGPPPAPGEDPAADFSATILGTTEEAWNAIFAERGATYQPPTLVLFTDVVRSGCGTASSQTGPFYCPLDQKLYLDLGFFRELERLGGPGDFAAAYVIGHEVGHHVQNLAGTADEVRSMQQQVGGAEANALSVALELQADCYAGVWANHANRTGSFLEPGDVEEGLGAAAAIGDDRLQRKAGGAVQPESFTHGSSAQRQQWLRTGLESGNPETCDTFAG